MTTTQDLTTLTSPPPAGTEIETLIGSLERMRRTFAWKCAGLGPDDLRRTLGPSSVSLGGLLKHLALVEDDSFGRKLLGEPDLSPPFDAVDFDADPDWEWRTAADDSPEELMALWERFAQRSRENIARVYAERGADAASGWTWPDGRTPSVRRLMVDLIEEYGRHTGHADLIRESIDGLVGEDPPA
jgi:uncharacterized damage-inducible protein DinB